MDSLSEAKYIMLAEHINAVHEELQFGCRRLNWNSLGMLRTEALIHVCCLVKLIFKLEWDNMCYLLSGIPDFVKQGAHAVSKFELVVSQIQKNENDIDSKLQSIAMANLLKFPIPDKTNDFPSKS